MMMTMMVLMMTTTMSPPMLMMLLLLNSGSFDVFLLVCRYPLGADWAWRRVRALSNDICDVFWGTHTHAHAFTHTILCDRCHHRTYTTLSYAADERDYNDDGHDDGDDDDDTHNALLLYAASFPRREIRQNTQQHKNNTDYQLTQTNIPSIAQLCGWLFFSASRMVVTRRSFYFSRETVFAWIVVFGLALKLILLDFCFTLRATDVLFHQNPIKYVYFSARLESRNAKRTTNKRNDTGQSTTNSERTNERYETIRCAVVRRYGRSTATLFALTPVRNIHTLAHNTCTHTVVIYRKYDCVERAKYTQQQQKKQPLLHDVAVMWCDDGKLKRGERQRCTVRQLGFRVESIECDLNIHRGGTQENTVQHTAHTHTHERTFRQRCRMCICVFRWRGEAAFKCVYTKLHTTSEI